MLGGGKGPREDAPLDWIGVLELINQGGAVALPHGGQQGCARGLTGIQAFEELGKAKSGTALAPLLDLGPAPVTGVKQEPFGRPLHQGGNGLHQLRIGQGRLPLGRGLDRPRHLQKGAGVEVLGEQLLGRGGPVVTRFAHGLNPAFEQSDPVLGGLGAVGRGALRPQSAPLGGGAAQVPLQGLALAAPSITKVPPAIAPERLKLGCKGCPAIEVSGQGVQLQRRIAIELEQQGLEAFRALEPAPHALKKVVGQGQNLLVPVVMGNLTHQGAAIALQLQRRGQAGFKGLALQGAAAEPMDGGDIGAIELLQGQQQPGLQGLGLGQLGLEPGGQHRIGGFEAGLLQAGQGLLQPLANPVAQFGGRGIGKGDHQHLSQAELRFGDQAQHQVGQGKGLACAGTGLQKSKARIEGKAIGVKSG